LCAKSHHKQFHGHELLRSAGCLNFALQCFDPVQSAHPVAYVGANSAPLLTMQGSEPGGTLSAAAHRLCALQCSLAQSSSLTMLLNVCGSFRCCFANLCRLQNQLATQLANYQQRVNYTESKLADQLRAMSQKLEAINHQTAAAAAAAAAAAPVAAAAASTSQAGGTVAAADRGLAASQRTNTFSKAAHAISPAIKWATSSRRGTSFGGGKGGRQSAPGSSAAAASTAAAAADQQSFARAGTTSADDLPGLNAVAEGGDSALDDAAAAAADEFGSATDLAGASGTGRSAFSRSGSAVSRASAASGASATSQAGQQPPVVEGEVLQQMQAMQQQMQAMMQMLQQMNPPPPQQQQ
jgi:hypothetical protein